MRLVGRAPPRPQLLQREHQLDRVEQRDDAREPRRRQAVRDPDELGARHVDVDETACEVAVGQGRSRLGRVGIEAVERKEVVDQVELVDPAAVDSDGTAVLERQLGLGVVRAVEGDEAELRPRRDEQLLAELARLARDEAFRSARGFAHRRPEVRVARRPRAPRG